MSDTDRSDIDRSSIIPLEEPEHCLVCGLDSHDVVCELCEKAPYCHDACEAADSISHSKSCEWKQQNLKQQLYCHNAGCKRDLDKLDDDFFDCEYCHGAAYCTRKCMERDAGRGHKLLCEPYQNIPPRPSVYHRLYVIFYAHEDKLQFVWLHLPADRKAKIKAIKNLITTGDQKIKRSENLDAAPRYNPFEVDKNWRELAVYHVANWSPDTEVEVNKSLSKAVGGRTLKHSMRGTILVEAVTYLYPDDWRIGDGHDPDEEELSDDPDISTKKTPSDKVPGYGTSDVMPGDLNRLLHYFRVEELRIEEELRNGTISDAGLKTDLEEGENGEEEDKEEHYEDERDPDFPNYDIVDDSEDGFDNDDDGDDRIVDDSETIEGGAVGDDIVMADGVDMADGAEMIEGIDAVDDSEMGHSMEEVKDS
ncbi:hypothetical protein Q7P37_011478 [Cladosporium fusiforme]